MRKLVRLLLWVFVFTQPWDTILLGYVGTLSRLVGLVTLGAACVTVAFERRVRRPSAIALLAAGFVAVYSLSLAWTVSPATGTVLAKTYAQLLASVWMIQEFVGTREEQQSLMFAFCLGAFVPTLDVLNNFRLGRRISEDGERYSSGGTLSLNANNLALTLLIALPMALYLTKHRVRIVRIAAHLYLVLGTIAVLLTGTRGVVLAGVIALLVTPLTQPRELTRFLIRIQTVIRMNLVIVCVTAAAVLVVPTSIWNRILTIRTELVDGGGMSGRAEMWNGGVEVFFNHPFLGVGAAGFAREVRPRSGGLGAAHNLMLEVLVEQGILGFAVFAALLAACALTIRRLPPAERMLWTGLMVVWFIGVSDLNFGASKATWLLFSLLAATSGEGRVQRQRQLQRRQSQRGAVLPTISTHCPITPHFSTSTNRNT